jgi:hypothetical protein
MIVPARMRESANNDRCASQQPAMRLAS